MNLSEIPNPKRLTRSQSDWYAYYAGFSPLFANAAIRHAIRQGGDLVLDPWNGAGTTTWAACLTGYRSTGFDLNPVMVEVARGRALPDCRAKAARRAVSRVVTAPPAHRGSDPLLVWFNPAAARTVRGLADACSSESDLAIRGFLLTALFNTVRSLTRPFRSANPTWVKQPPSGGIRVAAAEITLKFKAEAERFMSRPQADWPGCKAGSPTIALADAAHLPLPDGAAGVVLTSPPYCTRIDYAQNTCVELAVLGQSPAEAAQLRDRLTGTTTIRDCLEPVTTDWGKSCCRLLQAILAHPSKSSANYYWKTFVQYFSDLYNGVLESARCLRPGGTAIFVVQDSRYKELHIDLAGIITEMAEPLGWVPITRLDYSSRRTIRNVNTRSRTYQAGLECVESVLWFKADG